MSISKELPFVFFNILADGYHREKTYKIEKKLSESILKFGIQKNISESKKKQIMKS